MTSQLQDSQSEPAANYQIRPLRASDLDRIVALEVELFGAGAWSYGMLADELGGAGRWYIAATFHDPSSIGPPPVVGYGGLWFDGEVAQIMTLGVARRHQGEGVGTQLITALIDRARHLGAQAVLLEVAVNNHAAIRLYTSFGFQQLGIRKRYYQPEDVDAYTMRLSLPDS